MRVLCLPGREWSRAKREEDVSEKEREEVVAVTKEEENIIIIITERVFCYNNVLTTFVKKPQKYELDKSPTNACMHGEFFRKLHNSQNNFHSKKNTFIRRERCAPPPL